MKFEHVLQIYWSKGLLMNGKLQSFQTPFNDIFARTGGFGWPMKHLLIKRFELHKLTSNPDTLISDVNSTFAESLNVFFAQLTSVNDTVFDLTRYNLLRLYLIKTTRGRCHALGKPSRGQRTWSNAWSAYHVNKTTRAFVSTHQKLEQQNRKEEKINYKLLKKKTLRKKKKETIIKHKVKINHWF